MKLLIVVEDDMSKHTATGEIPDSAIRDAAEPDKLIRAELKKLAKQIASGLK